jgi:hypothetical protein
MIGKLFGRGGTSQRPIALAGLRLIAREPGLRIPVLAGMIRLFAIGIVAPKATFMPMDVSWPGVVFVGRSAELEELRAALTEALGGSSRAVLISGAGYRQVGAYRPVGPGGRGSRCTGDVGAGVRTRGRARVLALDPDRAGPAPWVGSRRSEAVGTLCGTAVSDDAAAQATGGARADRSIHCRREGR